MTDFKEFDKVKVMHSCSGTKPGKVYTLRASPDDDNSLYAVDKPFPHDGLEANCGCINNWVLIPEPDLRKSILT